MKYKCKGSQIQREKEEIWGGGERGGNVVIINEQYEELPTLYIEF